MPNLSLFRSITAIVAIQRRSPFNTVSSSDLTNMTAQPDNTTISGFSGLIPVPQDDTPFSGGEGDLSHPTSVASGRTTPPAYYKFREVAKLVFGLVVLVARESPRARARDQA
jgi:hypothetical protein